MSTTESEHVLEPRECLRLLRSMSIGRVVYTESALPAIRLVGFAVPDGEVVVAAGRDGWGARLDGTVVAFEAGEIDPGSRAGWSVVVVGRARLVGNPSGLSAQSAPEAGSALVAIDIERISGRDTTALPALPRSAVPGVDTGSREVSGRGPIGFRTAP
jgi:hypothetical protein